MKSEYFFSTSITPVSGMKLIFHMPMTVEHRLTAKNCATVDWPAAQSDDVSDTI
jgi:hypothetical protein